MVDENYFMQKAVDEAWKYQGLTFPNPPVAALIVDKDQKIVSLGVHKKAGLSHAELDAVKNALLFYGADIKENDPSKLHSFIIKNYKSYFKDHDIYVTLEPCNHYGKTPPCSMLLKEMGFKKVFISVKDPNSCATGGGELLKNYTTVYEDVLKEEGEKLIHFFKIWQKKGSFVFFKVAVSKNNVYTGGVISSKRSRELVHKIREIIDLLVIGGESVRVDRPTLDTRLSSGKNPPDVLILSKKDDFDKDIPLFKVKNRKVFISDNLDILQNYRYIMIEGGENLYNLLKDQVDAVMIFQSDKILNGKSFKFADEFKRLKKFKYFDDTIEWKVKESL